MAHTTPTPGKKAPTLKVDVIGGSAIDLASDRPTNFSLILFYRGVHCPTCKGQIEELNGKLLDFESLGIKVHVVSMDDRARAERQKGEWAIDNVPIGYGLTEESARTWGLFISAKEKDTEPERFAEPGVAVVYPDGTIYALYLQSVPFARPTLDGLMRGLKFIIDNHYPARGTVAA